MVNRYSGLGVPVEDLRQEAYIGIFKAKEHFDKNKKVKFSSYAIWWIRQSIINALNTQSRLVHMPSGKINLFRKIKNLTDAYMMKYNRAPTDVEIKMELQLNKNEYVDVDGLKKQAFYIDKEIKEDSNATMKNFFVFSNEFESEIDNNDVKKGINIALEKLTKREKFIIEHFFGLNDNLKLGLEEVGFKLNLTRERCRQIKRDALKKMKKNIQDYV